MKVPQGTAGRDIVSWILTLALGFSAVDLTLFLVTNAVGQGVNPLTWFLLIFAGAFVPLAYLSWRQNRRGYLVAAVVATVFNLLNLGDPTFPYLFTNPAHPNFAPVLAIVIACSLVTLYGVYGFYKLRRSGTLPSHVNRVSIPALLALGFALGGLFIGALAAGTQTRLLTAAGIARDVTIVAGADNPTNAQFYDPETLTVTVGKTVVWFNGDPVAHTITSAHNAFDSGNVNSGEVYRNKFAQTGSFDYHCVYHPWMTGSVVVLGS